jgi:hypothetical protein
LERGATVRAGIENRRKHHDDQPQTGHEETIGEGGGKGKGLGLPDVNGQTTGKNRLQSHARIFDEEAKVLPHHPAHAGPKTGHDAGGLDGRRLPAQSLLQTHKAEHEKRAEDQPTEEHRPRETHQLSHPPHHQKVEVESEAGLSVEREPVLKQEPALGGLPHPSGVHHLVVHGNGSAE